VISASDNWHGKCVSTVASTIARVAARGACRRDGPDMETVKLDWRRRAVQQIKRRPAMLYWTVLFLVVALVAGALGFGVIGGMAYTAAKILFFIFLVLFILSLFTGAVRRPVP
jgi:uncharacterized membrane protein YtjA (UPF0391 family)